MKGIQREDRQSKLLRYNNIIIMLFLYTNIFYNNNIFSLAFYVLSC